MTKNTNITKQEFFEKLFLSLRKINQLIIRVNNEIELFEKMGEILVRDLNFSAIIVGKIDPITQNLNIVYKTGFNSYFDDIQISIDNSKEYGQETASLAFKTNKIIINQNIKSNQIMKFWKEKLLKHNLNSNCAIPISRNNNITYIILIYSNLENFFTQDILPILNELKDDIEFALSKIQIQESLKNYIKFYETLSKVNQLIIKSLSKEDLFKSICDIFIQHSMFDLAGLYLIDPLLKLELKYYALKNEKDLDYLLYVNKQFKDLKQNWPTAKALNKGFIFINNNTLENKNLASFRQKMLEHNLLSSCALPIMQGNKVIGVINLYSNKSLIFDKNTYSLLKEIVGDISYALERFENQKWIQMFSIALNTGFDFVVITDDNFNIVYVNDTTLLVSGYSKEELIGKKTHRYFYERLHSREYTNNFYNTLKNKKVFSDVFLYKTKKGKIVQSYTIITPYNFNNETYYIAIGKDLTKDKDLQLKLDYYINHDPVTNLANQKYFLEKIEILIEGSIDPQLHHSMIIIDPKDFGNINTFYGLNVGDDVLKEIAKNLKSVIKNDDFLAKLSENKFGVFIKNLQTKDEILDYIENFKNVLNKPISTFLGEINLEFSIGISFFPDDARNAQDLFSKAYIALQHAKKDRYTYKFYQHTDEEHLIKQIQLKNDLRKAATEKEFIVFFNPM